MASLHWLRAIAALAGWSCLAGIGAAEVNPPTACPSHEVMVSMANDGSVMAQWVLARQLLRGGGEPTKDALEWLRRAAHGGNPTAQYTLGGMYLEGKGLSPDAHQAGLWLMQAAEQGHQLSQKQVMRLYAEGIGVPKDAYEASHWQYRAARGDEQRRMSLQHALRPATDQPQRAPMAEYVDRATSGSVLAQYTLGRMLFDAPVGVRDEHKAVYWLEQAARSGHLQAMLDVGKMLALSDDEPDSQARALAWLKGVPSAAQGRAARVMGEVGRQYASGGGVSKDSQRGIFWTTKAAESGDVLAQIDLARSHVYGFDMPVDLTRAIVWYERAAQQDAAPAQYALARLLLERTDGVRHEGEAYFWWALSARKGYIGGELNAPDFWDQRSIPDRANWDQKVRTWHPQVPERVSSQWAEALDRLCP